MSEDPATKTRPQPAPPGWDKWKRQFRIEATLEVVEANFQELIRHLQTRSGETGPQPGCCAMACLGYAVGGLCLMFTAPYLLKRGTWAGDLFIAFGFKNWGYLALAGLVAVGVHAFRPRPGPVENRRLAPLQTLLERLQNGLLAEAIWRDAHWALELNLVALEETLPETSWERSTFRQEKTKTYEQEWLRLRAKGPGGRTIELRLESELVERSVSTQKTKADGRVKSSLSTKEPRLRHVLHGKLVADDLRIALARRALYDCSMKGVSEKDRLREEEGSLRVAWVVKRDDLETSGLRLLKLGEALAAGAP